MNEHFCYGCEHVWSDIKEADHCPDCGCQDVNIEAMDNYEEDTCLSN